MHCIKARPAPAVHIMYRAWHRAVWQAASGMCVSAKGAVSKGTTRARMGLSMLGSDIVPVAYQTHPQRKGQSYSTVSL